MNDSALRERVAGGLIGLLVGDALGVPYEFHAREDIPTSTEIEFDPPAHLERSHKGIPLGTWSDDGAQALVLLASLLDCGKFDLTDFAKRLVNWYTDGYMAVDQRVFDVGIQTAQALQKLKNGVAPAAARSDEQANGNGSLMRVLPLVLWHRGPDSELVEDAHQQSIVTHGHVRSQVCCALYCLWARSIFDGVENPWEQAVNTLRRIYEDDSVKREELESSIRPDGVVEIQGSGYVVDSLHSARWAMQHKTYEGVVRAAISLGNDTDTTACIAGGLAGIRDGIRGIPERWVQSLRGREIYQPLLERLVEWRSC
jgi:ADP-ribosyl-[dinitrogen reductase] hydrolase